MLISSVVALNDEVIEYSIRLEHGGWTVYNIVTLEAAVYRGVRMAHLFAQEAEDLGDMLNAMERAAPGSSIARTDSSR